MSEATLLESRVDKIERDNRRLKLTVGALLLVLAAVPLIGAVMPEQIPDVIQARAFHVIDDGSRSSEIVIFDSDRNRRIVLADWGITVTTPEWRGRVSRSVMWGQGFYYSENSTPRASMDAEGFQYWDENNHMRAQLGSVVLTTPSTGAETTYPAQVVLFDDDEKVIWSAVGR
jgi:hypothetical protein